MREKKIYATFTTQIGAVPLLFAEEGPRPVPFSNGNSPSFGDKKQSGPMFGGKKRSGSIFGG